MMITKINSYTKIKSFTNTQSFGMSNISDYRMVCKNLEYLKEHLDTWGLMLLGIYPKKEKDYDNQTTKRTIMTIVATLKNRIDFLSKIKKKLENAPINYNDETYLRDYLNIVKDLEESYVIEDRIKRPKSTYNYDYLPTNSLEEKINLLTKWADELETKISAQYN